MATIKLHKHQKEALKLFKVPANAKIRFIGDLDVNSMYFHSINAIAPPKWTLRAFTELDRLQQEELEASFIFNHPKLLWSEPAAVATHPDSQEHRIPEEMAWIAANTKSCVILEHCPFMNQNTFLFMDWDEALAFKLAFVDK